MQRLTRWTTRISCVCCLFASASVALVQLVPILSQRADSSFVYASVATDHLPFICSVPHRSVLGPLGFIAYTEDLTAVSYKHTVHSHMCADDTQLYDSSTHRVSLRPSDQLCVRCCQIAGPDLAGGGPGTQLTWGH